MIEIFPFDVDTHMSKKHTSSVWFFFFFAATANTDCIGNGQAAARLDGNKMKNKNTHVKGICKNKQTLTSKISRNNHSQQMDVGEWVWRSTVFDIFVVVFAATSICYYYSSFHGQSTNLIQYLRKWACNWHSVGMWIWKTLPHSVVCAGDEIAHTNCDDNCCVRTKCNNVLTACARCSLIEQHSLKIQDFKYKNNFTWHFRDWRGTALQLHSFSMLYKQMPTRQKCSRMGTNFALKHSHTDTN